MNDSRPARRDIPLVLIVFAATLIVLAGGWSILSRAPSTPGPASAGASAIAVAGSPSVSSPGSSPDAVSSGGVAPGATPLVPVLTPGPSGEVPTVTLTGAGDIAVCNSDGAALTSDLMLRQPGWFFTIGDNAYEDGSDGNFATCYAPTWGRILDRTILPVIGNHDWLTKGASGYMDYFGARATPNGKDYYSIDLGGWHIVVLDSDCSKVGGCKPGTPQGDWLAQDLASSTAHCTLALWHHPRFSSGEHGDQLQVAPFWQMLYDANADLILNGHDHDYERFAPMDPSGQETRPNGIREIVVGTGGGALREFHEIQPNSEFRLQKVFGVVQLTLHPASYDWQFMPADGSQITDAGSTPCH